VVGKRNQAAPRSVRRGRVLRQGWAGAWMLDVITGSGRVSLAVPTGGGGGGRAGGSRRAKSYGGADSQWGGMVDEHPMSSAHETNKRRRLSYPALSTTPRHREDDDGPGAMPVVLTSGHDTVSARVCERGREL
jgi:hypothetical protein